jgi:hypothetical protein
LALQVFCTHKQQTANKHVLVDRARLCRDMFRPNPAAARFTKYRGSTAEEDNRFGWEIGPAGAHIKQAVRSRKTEPLVNLSDGGVPA